MYHRVRFALALCAMGSLFATGCTGGAMTRIAPTTSTEAASRPPAAAAGGGVVALGSYNIDPSKVFVAGISSGGFFGVQMHVAHSSLFKGAAIYAGGVYYCALDNIGIALAACGGEGLYQSTLAASEAYLDQQSSAGTIDAATNLRGAPVYLWSGTQDTIVKPLEMNDLETEYEHYGANVIKYDNAFPAGHGWESPDGELACGTQGSPYMISCPSGRTAYDSEKTWLKAFFGKLKPRNDGTLKGTLVRFDQTAFGAGASNSMDTNGYVFVPKGCAAGEPCGVVLALHGCLQTQADIGTKFIAESGIDGWADRNNIVVLYPYAAKSSTVPLNPNGCWDWWGYADSSYALKNGTQISIVYKMVQRLMGR
jgi:poly(3-hydroxybutyrate) depolymerase